MQAVGHLARAGLHAAFRLLVTAFFCASISSALVLVVSYAATRAWPPRGIEIVTLAVVAALVTYAGVVTVLLVELISGIFKGVEVVDHELVGVARGVERELDPFHERSRAS